MPIRIAALLALVALAPVVASAQSQQANLITVASLATTPGDERPANARGELLLAGDGNFYVATYGGGANAAGVIARITPAGVVTTLHSFTGNNGQGAQSYARLLQASDGNLYGTTYLGGADGRGTVFRIATDGTGFTTVYSFPSGRGAPMLPYTGLVEAGDGNLYGTTMRGGAADQGVVFRLSLSGTFALVHEFTGDEGQNPEGTLAVGPNGDLYGTTLTGGANNRGTIYRISTAGTFTSLYSFPPLGAFSAAGVATNPTGANPRAGLTPGADGNLYGTAYQGGANGYGTVFRVTPAGDVTALHSFTGATLGGAFPLGGVVQDVAGNLYGTTEQGGYLNRGSAWRLTSGGAFSLLHGFIGSVSDGITPYAGLTLVGNDLYGISYSDSVGGAGAVFRLDLGTGGVLPVQLSVSPSSMTVGGSATLTWNSPTAASCTTSGSWADTVSVSGTLAVTPVAAGIYNYALSCTDGAGLVRRAYASMTVNAPAAQPVDGGGGGGGAMSPGLLLLLGAMLWVIKGRRGPSPA